MKALFEEAPAPYPVDVSDSVVCDPSFAPVFQTNDTLAYFVGYLNNRMTFGSCSKDQAVYRGVLAFLHCPQRESVLQIELIIPKEKYTEKGSVLTEQFLSLRCAN